MTFLLRVATFSAAMWAVIALSNTAMAQQPVKIGLTGPYTGGSQAMGLSMRNGAKLAVDEINAKGGINIGGVKRPIQLVERDDEAKNPRGVEIAKELVEQEKVVATVGYINTGVALASQKYYQAAQIPVLNNVATGSLVTMQFDAPSYIFRNSCNDTIQSAMIVEEAIVRRGFKRVAILADTTAYGYLGTADLVKTLAARRIIPVAVEKFNVRDTDMTTQVERAREAGAEVILTYGIGPELAIIAKTRSKLGWDVPIIGSWTLSMASFIDGAGEHAEGAIMPQTFIQQPTTAKRRSFIEAYQVKYSIDRIPSPVSAAQGYDSVYLLAAAIEQANSTEGSKIRDALENLQTRIEGVVTVYERPFSHDDHEAISANIPVMGIVRNGRVVPAHPEDLAGANAVRVKTRG